MITYEPEAWEHKVASVTSDLQQKYILVPWLFKLASVKNVQSQISKGRETEDA